MIASDINAGATTAYAIVRTWYIYAFRKQSAMTLTHSRTTSLSSSWTSFDRNSKFLQVWARFPFHVTNAFPFHESERSLTPQARQTKCLKITAGCSLM
jgi:hypothetical protein